MWPEFPIKILIERGNFPAPCYFPLHPYLSCAEENKPNQAKPNLRPEEMVAREKIVYLFFFSMPLMETLSLANTHL